MLTKVLLIFLLISAMGLSGWSILLTKKNSVTKPVSFTHAPDAYMENVVATVINKKGTPSFKISSPKMIHYKENDTTDITTPEIIVFRDSPEPWDIHSNYAKATQGIDQIFFWDHVKIHHASDNKNPETTMITHTLMVYPNKQIAQTQDAITFLRPDTIVHAIGMHANLEMGTIKLLSEAKGEYAPNS